MTTPAKEPQEISEETTTNSETICWVKWDVDMGRDRTMDVPTGTSFTLAGSPSIQGIEIRGRKVTLHGWADTWPSGNPSLTVEGPTGGKEKVDPKRRIGSYRLEIRD